MLLVNPLEESGLNYEWLLDSKTIGELQEKCSSIIVSRDERNHASITSFSPAGELLDGSFSKKFSKRLSCQGFIFAEDKNTLVRPSGENSSGDERFAELLVEGVKNGS